MKIKYEIVKDDYLKFNMYHINNSKKSKKEMMLHRIFVPIGIAGLAFAFNILTQMPLMIGIPLFFGAAILWAIFFPKYYKQNAMKNVSKMLGDGIHSNSISKYTLTVKEEGLLVSSQAGQNVQRWNEIKKFVETDEYIFIYVTESMANVIPKRCFKNKAEEEEFIKRIKEKI